MDKSKIKRFLSYKGIIICLAVLFFPGITAITIILVYPEFDPNHNTSSLEIMKGLIQLVVVVVLGGLVSIIAASSNSDRQRKESMRVLQRKFYEDFIQAYNNAKRIRRLLRANIRDDMIDLKIYEVQMQKLEGVQLQFEALKRLSGSLPDLEDFMYSHLRKIEDYLRCLTREYEKNCGSSDSGKKATKDLELYNFIGREGSSKSKFWYPTEDLFKYLPELLTKDLPGYIDKVKRIKVLIKHLGSDHYQEIRDSVQSLMGKPAEKPGDDRIEKSKMLLEGLLEDLRSDHYQKIRGFVQSLIDKGK